MAEKKTKTGKTTKKETEVKATKKKTKKADQENEKNLEKKENLKKTLAGIFIFFGVVQTIPAFLFDLSLLLDVGVMIGAGLLYLFSYQKWLNYVVVAYSSLNILGVVWILANTGYLNILSIAVNIGIIILGTKLLLLEKEPKKQ